MVARAFVAPWKLKEVVDIPSSGSFWRDNGIGKFAISHRIKRGDSIVGLAVKYSVQVMDIKRLNNMMSDHGIYSRERFLIPISNPDILIDSTCYIELDNHAKREVAVLYPEGVWDIGISSLLKRTTSEQGKKRILESLRRLGGACRLMMVLLSTTCLSLMATQGLHSLNSPKTLGGRDGWGWPKLNG